VSDTDTSDAVAESAPASAGGHDPAELDQFLRPALDAAMVWARSKAEEDGTGAVPARIRPFLRVPTLPRAGLTAARLAIETDAELRQAVAETVEESELGRGPWLWIARPTGWRDELDGLWEAWHEDRVRNREQVEERSTRRLLEKANDTVKRLESRVSQLEAILASTEGDLARARADAVSTVTQRDGALADARRLGAERTEAVRQLKSTEERLAARTAELRSARSVTPEPEVTAEAELPREALASALRHVNARLDELVRGVAGLGEMVGDDAVAAEEAGSDRRRRPVRVGRGIAEDSTSAAEVLVSLAGSVTFVDGYNLTMTAWPTLSASDQRQALIRAAGAVATRTGSEIHLVFDGDDGGGQPARSTPAVVRVRFTSADVEADDEILDLIGSVPVDRPVVVVSDDRRVRHGARARGANVVGSRQFQPLLLR
jgi:predicted RNA-binding protein with PIN domain